MKTLKQYNLELNREVAAVLGWTDIFEINGTLLGRPKNGSPHSRDQAMIPNWTDDFAACCQLCLRYRITPHQSSIESFMKEFEEKTSIRLSFEQAYRRIMLLHTLPKLHAETGRTGIAQNTKHSTFLNVWPKNPV